MIRRGSAGLSGRAWKSWIPSRGKDSIKAQRGHCHPELFPHALPAKEFLEGALIATRSRAENLREIAVRRTVGDHSADEVHFQECGYPEVLKKQKAKP